MPLRLNLTCFFAALLLPASTWAADRYVSATGNDANSCSISAPCREIRRALTLVSAGDTIHVAAGAFKGFTVSNVAGTAAAPITILGSGASTEILPTTDRGSYEDRDNIYITFSRYIVVDSVRTRSAPRAGIRIDASHYVTVRNCESGNNGTWGLFTNHSNNPLIENSEFYGSAVEHGIYISNSGDNPTIRGNNIHDNNANGIHMNGDLSAGSHGGVVGDGVISGALVENNVIYRNGRAGGSGINMDGVQGSIIRNNVLYDNHASGITAYRIDGGQGPRDLQIYHNTIDMASDARYALQIQQSIGPIQIRNNILYNRNPARGGLAYGNNTDVTNVNSAYNIFGGAVIVSFNDWSDRISLVAWQAQGGEPNSFASTLGALFVDSNNYNYQLRAASPAINTGQTLGAVAADREGDARPQGSASDIGADEFFVPDALAPQAPQNLRVN